MSPSQLRMQDIAVVQPQYRNGAVASEIVLVTGERAADERSPHAVVRAALAGDGVEWRTYAKLFADGRHGRQSLPIVHGDRAWMTCRMLKPRVKGDAVYGFVALDRVASIKEDAGAGVLTLDDGTEIGTIVRLDTLRLEIGRTFVMLQERRMIGRRGGASGDDAERARMAALAGSPSPVIICVGTAQDFARLWERGNR